jgi:hypothetical protein
VVEPVRRRTWRRGVATAVAAVAAVALVAGVAVARRGSSTAAAARATEALRSHDGKTSHHDRTSSHHSSHVHSSHEQSSHEHERSHGASQDGGAQATYSYTYSSRTVKQSELLNNSGVQEALLATGRSLSYSYSYGELDTLLPRTLTSKLAADLIAGDVGEDALGGYVAFGLSYLWNSTITAGWIIVMNLYGDVVKISSTYGAMIGTANVTADEMYHPLALKLVNATHLLVALGTETGSLAGPRFLWDWSTDTYTELAGGNTNDAHDINWSHDGNRFWQMDGTSALKEWESYATGKGSGKAVEKVRTHRLADPNHAQLCEDDTVAYISSRNTNAIVKVNVTTGDVLWTLGGEYGDYDIVDFDGAVHPRGSTVFVGQHNAEYFGESEYCMFDNQYDTGNNSRMLCVVLDEADGSAYLSWECVTSAASRCGGCCRLPSVMSRVTHGVAPSHWQPA